MLGNYSPVCQPAHNYAVSLWVGHDGLCLSACTQLCSLSLWWGTTPSVCQPANNYAVSLWGGARRPLPVSLHIIMQSLSGVGHDAPCLSACTQLCSLSLGWGTTPPVCQHAHNYAISLWGGARRPLHASLHIIMQSLSGVSHDALCMTAYTLLCSLSLGWGTKDPCMPACTQSLPGVGTPPPACQPAHSRFLEWARRSLHVRLHTVAAWSGHDSHCLSDCTQLLPGVGMTPTACQTAHSGCLGLGTVHINKLTKLYNTLPSMSWVVPWASILCSSVMIVLLNVKYFTLL